MSNLLLMGIMVCIAPFNVLVWSHLYEVVMVNPRTLEWMRKRFGVSMLYLDALLDMSWGAKPGFCCFDRNDDGRTVVQTGL